MYHHHAGLTGDQSDRCEILERIVRQLFIKPGVPDVRGRMHQQRVAVGGRFCYHIRAYRAGCAATVVDEKLLAHDLCQFLRHDAPRQVVGAARRPCNHHAHLLGGVSLGGLRRRRTVP